MYVNLSAGDVQFMVIIAANFPLEMHETVELTLNMDKMHLFEKKGDMKSVAHTPKNTAELGATTAE
jgi:hypothetical protein